MSENRKMKNAKCCPACGAPAVSEVCQYCGVATGLKTAEAQMEYPILDCKEAALNFFSFWFPMIFAVAFGVPALIMLPLSIITIVLLIVDIPFLLIGGGGLFFVIRTLIRNNEIKKNGKLIQAVVYGYVDDNFLVNNKPAQKVKLLVNTPEGPRFIMYSLGKTIKPYAVNSTIDLLVYKNYFVIQEKKEIMEW